MSQALEVMKQDGTIVYPTETFYGLGCDATSRKAIKKIYQIKGREGGKALPFLVDSLKMAGLYLRFSPLAFKLAKRYWPGPLSLVLPATSTGKKMLGRPDGGTRISGNKFATGLVKNLGKPVISTSANPAGRRPAASAQDVIKYFKRRKSRPDLIIDAGRLPKSKGSTFIDLTGKNPKILREGDIKISF